MRQTQPHPEGPFQSFVQSFHIARWLMQFIALTCMVWIRTDFGYRMVSPARILPVTLFLFVLSVMASNGDPAKRQWGLLIFSILTLILGTYKYIRCRFEASRKVKRHSYYLGTSLFNKLRWIPESLRKSRRSERFLDPLAIGLLGYTTIHFSPALGMMLMLSAISLRSYEWAIYTRDLHLNQDLLDGAIHSQQQNEMFEEFEAQSGWHKNETPNGIPSGVGADLESQITISVKQRKAKTNDNTINI